MKTMIKKGIYGTLDAFYELKGKTLGNSAANPKANTIHQITGEEIYKLLQMRRGNVGISVYDCNENKQYGYNDEIPFETASIIKVAIMMAMVSRYEKLNHEHQKLIYEMITTSDNNATTELWNELGGDQFMKDWFKKLNINHTLPGTEGYWGLSQTTAKDQVQLLKLIVKPNKLFSDKQREYLKDTMSKVIRSQKWGISSGWSGNEVSLKNGWSPRRWNEWKVNSIGFVGNNGEARFIISVLSEGSPSEKYGIKTVEQISSLINNLEA